MQTIQDSKKKFHCSIGGHENMGAISLSVLNAHLTVDVRRPRASSVFSEH